VTHPLVPLRAVAYFVRGVSFKPGDVRPLGTEGTVACFRTKNVQSEIDLDDLWAVPISSVNRSEQILEEGDLLVSTANSWNLVGKCCWVPKLDWPATLGGFISALRPILAKVTARFLYHWFSWEPVQAKLRRCARRTTNISNLDLSQALDLEIPLPPLEMQQRIAATLDKAECLRQNRRAALQKLGVLTQSIFFDMFGDPSINSMGWPVQTLGEILELLQYGPRFYNESYTASGVRIARITDLNQNGKLNFGSMPKLDVDEQNQEKHLLRPGDLIFARTGATVGKLSLIKRGDPKCIAGAYFIRLHFREDEVEPTYIRSLLASPPIQAIVIKQSRQAAQQNFSGPALRRLRIPLPPLTLQRVFSERLSELEAVETSFDQSERKFDSLLSALRHHAFHGTL
jgi:type I restriction enzyme S subunit